MHTHAHATGNLWGDVSGEVARHVCLTQQHNIADKTHSIFTYDQEQSVRILLILLMIKMCLNRALMLPHLHMTTCMTHNDTFCISMESIGLILDN